MTGTLFVVATPLGNLGDLSTRAAETLRQVAVVAAEDTRRTKRLLNHLDAHPRLMSLPAFAEDDRADAVLSVLEKDLDVALVSDAGTPGVSDPGTVLVARARARDIPVVPIPGPSAVATALSASGLPADRYLFLGFPPRKGTSRKELLATIAKSPWTVVLYESPNRLGALLKDLGATVGGERAAVVGRELTKLHEEIVVGTLDELAARFAEASVKGEVTVVVAGQRQAPPEPDSAAVAEVAAALIAEGLPTKDIVRQLTENWGLSRNDGYRLVMRLS
jgi:16S rRNA (cytidine1402-2'-O)-methyltransferase